MLFSVGVEGVFRVLTRAGRCLGERDSSMVAVWALLAVSPLVICYGLTSRNIGPATMSGGMSSAAGPPTARGHVGRHGIMKCTISMIA